MITNSVLYLSNFTTALILSFVTSKKLAIERIIYSNDTKVVQKILNFFKNIFDILIFAFSIFIFLSAIPFLLHKINNSIVSTITNCIFLGIDLLIFGISIAIWFTPEYDYKKIEELGIDNYYSTFDSDFKKYGNNEILIKLEKEYINKKYLKWIKKRNSIIIKFIKEDTNSFIYFLFSTLIAIILFILGEM